MTGCYGDVRNILIIISGKKINIMTKSRGESEKGLSVYK